jgi:glycosyltransferase involved in cell wall biosynthesis
MTGPVVAVIIPCKDEERTIRRVVEDFRSELPEATVYVFDNGSADLSVSESQAAGATVRSVPPPGKGHVVRRMFADVDADVYLLVDGDDTYDPAVARALVQAVTSGGNDLANGVRVAIHDRVSPRGHQLGGRLLTRLVEKLFGRRVEDMLSGCKAFSRRFVKSFPAVSHGFEIETELTVHALSLDMPVANIPVAYRPRRPESPSKLQTYKDGFRILRTIAGLVRNERPLAFFGVLAALLTAIAIALGIPLIVTFAQIHRVPRFPTAILATGLVVLASLSMVCGLVLDTVTRGRREAKRYAYLAVPGPLQESALLGSNRAGASARSAGAQPVGVPGGDVWPADT